MPDPSRARRLAILGSLYLAQGIVYGFGGLILVPSLAAAGVALEAQAGILALASVPWVLKLLWAPLLDRFGVLGSGRARWFAAMAMLAMAVVLAVLAGRESLVAEPVTLAWLWLLLNAALSLQDVSTDALVLDLVPPGERGVTNGVLLGGHHLGAEGIGGLALGLFVASRGLLAALWVQSAIMLALAGLPLLLPRREESATPASPRLADVLAHLVTSPRALAVAEAEGGTGRRHEAAGPSWARTASRTSLQVRIDSRLPTRSTGSMRAPASWQREVATARVEESGANGQAG